MLRTMTIDHEILEDKLAALREEHRDLDDVIDRLMQTVPVDFVQMQRLKKRKLALKDAIQKLENDMIPDIIA